MIYYLPTHIMEAKLQSSGKKTKKKALAKTKTDKNKTPILPDPTNEMLPDDIEPLQYPTKNTTHTPAVLYLKYILLIISIFAVCAHVYIYADSDIGRKMVTYMLAVKNKVSVIPYLLRLLKDALPPMDMEYVHEMPDYALYTSGARIIASHTSPSYVPSGIPSGIPRRLFTILAWLKGGIINSPTIAIQPSKHIGECWPLAGSQGQLAIALSMFIKITHITIEHPARHILLNTGSTPWDMELWGQPANESCSGEICNPVFLTAFAYNMYGQPVQTFSVVSAYQNTLMQSVILKIASNWGEPNYTCLYKVGIHGRRK
jgi:hypothetical protein